MFTFLSSGWSLLKVKFMLILKQALAKTPSMAHFLLTPALFLWKKENVPELKLLVFQTLNPGRNMLFFSPESEINPIQKCCLAVAAVVALLTVKTPLSMVERVGKK